MDFHQVILNRYAVIRPAATVIQLSFHENPKILVA